jgi:hypothetical protein
MDFAFVRQKTIPKLKLLAPSPPPPAKEGKKYSLSSFEEDECRAIISR